MQRYFGIDKNNDKIVLQDNDYHHIKNVMRMHTGDKVECVIDNRLYLCEIDSNYEVKIVIEKEQIDDKYPDIYLIIPALKEQKMDLIFQKATELGVKGFIIYPFKRSMVKIEDRKEKVKLERWIKICKEASEQSMRLDIPTISIAKGIEDLEKLDGLKLVCSTNERENYIKDTLKNKRECDKLFIVVGPEGGLDDKEEELLVKKGFKKITLGTQIMRVETVPIFLTSVIRYEYTE